MSSQIPLPLCKWCQMHGTFTMGWWTPNALFINITRSKVSFGNLWILLLTYLPRWLLSFHCFNISIDSFRFTIVQSPSSKRIVKFICRFGYDLSIVYWLLTPDILNAGWAWFVWYLRSSSEMVESPFLVDLREICCLLTGIVPGRLRQLY